MTDKHGAKRLTMLYTGLEVVPASDYEALERENTALKDRLHRISGIAAEHTKEFDGYEKIFNIADEGE